MVFHCFHISSTAYCESLKFCRCFFARKQLPLFAKSNRPSVASDLASALSPSARSLVGSLLQALETGGFARNIRPWRSAVIMAGGFKGEIIGKYHRYIPYIPHSWLVVSNMAFIFHFIYGMSSQPHWRTHIFQDGHIAPATRWKIGLGLWDEMIWLLVTGLPWEFYDFPETVRNFIIPTDEVHDFSEGLVGIPPISQSWDSYGSCPLQTFEGNHPCSEVRVMKNQWHLNSMCLFQFHSIRWVYMFFATTMARWSPMRVVPYVGIPVYFVEGVPCFGGISSCQQS